MKSPNLIGQTFNRLTVIADGGYYQEPKGQRRKQWICRCECGTETTVTAKHLKSGNTKSCGCLQRESVIKKNYIHGLSSHPLYIVWNGMKRRCHDPNMEGYSRYGAVGISVCEQWRNDFKSFYDWALSNRWEKGLQIDRINGHGNYCPKNCRIVTPRINCLNRKSIKTTNTSGHTGVTRRKDNNRWRSGICIKGECINLGSHGSAMAAAVARDKYIIANNISHLYKVQVLNLTQQS